MALKSHSHLVSEFNEQIIGIIPPKPARILTESEFGIRMKMMYEELTEFEEAFYNDDIVNCLDALIDLEYFLLGTAHMMGIHRLNYDTCFNIVHNANMNKKKGINKKREVTNESGESEPDAIKPKGWTSPENMMTQFLKQMKVI